MVLSLPYFPSSRMKHTRMLALATLCALLSACSMFGPSTQQPSQKVGGDVVVPAEVTITPGVNSQESQDDDGMYQSTFTLSLVMPPLANTSIPLAMEYTEEGPAMQRLNASTYKGTNIIAAYEYYWAGGGFQAVVRKAAGALVFERRNTSEGSEEVEGGCDKWTNVGTLPIGADTAITINDADLAVQDNLVIGCAW